MAIHDYSPAIEKLIAAARELERDFDSWDESEQHRAILAVLAALEFVDAEAKAPDPEEACGICRRPRKAIEHGPPWGFDADGVANEHHVFAPAPT